MNKEQLWRHILEKNARFGDMEFAMTPELLRKMFDLVWNQAVKNTIRAENPHSKGVFEHIFGKINVN